MADPPDPDATARHAVEARENFLYRALLAGAFTIAMVLGTYGASVLTTDRARLDVIETTVASVIERVRGVEATQRTMTETLADVRADLRVMGSQLTELRSVATRIEERVSRAPAAPPR